MAKTDVYITIKLGELRYELELKTYLSGRTGLDGEGYAEASDAMMSGDSEERDTLLRCLGDALSRVKHVLGEHMDEGSHRGNDLLPVESDEVTLHLSLPSNYDSNATDDLASSLHRYIVDSTLAEWYTLTRPDESKVWSSKSRDDLLSLHDAIYRRRRPTRRVPGGGTDPGDTDLLWHDALLWQDAREWQE